MMDTRLFYQITADGILVLHVLFILFVVLGLVLILAGRVKKWAWTRNPWFRVFHLAAILIVMAQTWLGIICPLTTWEMYFREKAGQFTYTGGFIEHWLHQLIFFEVAPWVFVLCYTLFGAAVIASLYLHPPDWHRRGEE